MPPTATLSPLDNAIRASDADRETALGLLRHHWLAGRLTLDEYERRCDEALAGRFLDDLRRSLRELPYPLPEIAPPLPPLPAPAGVAAPPAPQAGAVLSLALGALSLAGVVMSLGMLFILTLPASTWAWSLGRRSARHSTGLVRAIALAGQTLAILATVLGCLALSACAAIVAAA